MIEQYLTIEHLSTKDLTRIFSKIKIDLAIQFNGSSCWMWTASRTRGGYGQIKWRNKCVTPHRLLYAWLMHPLPLGKAISVIDHLCRNRACCNPAHLEAVTELENCKRGYGIGMVNARKTHCPQGHPYEGDNVFIDKKHKQRLCRACKREGELRRYYARKKAELKT